MICDKYGFPTERAARRQLAEIRRQKPGHPGRVKGKKPMRHYKCPVCELWHLTSSTTDRARRHR
jgi:hypothetical protein